MLHKILDDMEVRQVAGLLRGIIDACQRNKLNLFPGTDGLQDGATISTRDGLAWATQVRVSEHRASCTIQKKNDGYLPAYEASVILQLCVEGDGEIRLTDPEESERVHEEA